MNIPFIDLGKDLFFESILSAKECLVLAYLRIHCNLLDEIITCIQWITTGIGYKPKSGKGNTLDQIRNVLNRLRSSGAIDFENVSKCTDQMVIKLNTDHVYFSPQSRFIKITADDIDKIVCANYPRKDILFAVYYTIRSYIFSTGDNKTSYCYPSENEILYKVRCNIDITHNTLNKVLEVLVKSNLLQCYHVGRYIDNSSGQDEIRCFPNIYCLGCDVMIEAECINLAKNVLRKRGIEVSSFIPAVINNQIPEIITVFENQLDESLITESESIKRPFAHIDNEIYDQLPF